MASITGIDVDLIKRFHVILKALSSSHKINVDKFQGHAFQTACNFVQLYPSFYMPISVHRNLLHGAQIINSSSLPTGQMSEDAQEIRKSFIERFRGDYARKFSREKKCKTFFKY